MPDTFGALRKPMWDRAKEVGMGALTSENWGTKGPDEGQNDDDIETVNPVAAPTPAGTPAQRMPEQAGQGTMPRPQAVPYPDSPEIAQLESSLQPKPLGTKGKILEAVSTFAPTIIAALAGGEAAASGASQGVVRAQEIGRETKLRRRGETMSRIKQARDLQQQRYETDVRNTMAQANLEATRAWRDQMSSDKRYGIDQNTETKLRKMGLDAQGNPIARESLTPAEQAALDYRDAQTEYAQARADALTNPNNPQLALRAKEVEGRLMALRMGLEFRRRADARANEALDLQRRNFEVATYGKDNGMPVPGAKITADGTPVGTKLQSNVGPTSTTRTMAQQGQATMAHVPDVRQNIYDLDQKGLLGPIVGRWEDFMAGKVGTGPEYANFRTNIGLMQTALMRTHVGARGGVSLMKHFESLLNTNGMDAPTLDESLKGIEGWLNTYAGQDTQVVGGQPTAPGYQQPAPASPGAGQPTPTAPKLRKRGDPSVNSRAGTGAQPAPVGTVIPVQGGGYKVKTAAGTWVRSNANGQPIQ